MEDHCKQCVYLQEVKWRYADSTWSTYYCRCSYEHNLGNDISPNKKACDDFKRKGEPQ